MQDDWLPVTNKKYQVKAERLDILVLHSGAVGREPLGDDEKDLPGLVVEVVPSKEDTAPEWGTVEMKAN